VLRSKSKDWLAGNQENVSAETLIDYQSFHVNKSFVESPKRKIYISVLLKNAFLFTVSWALNT
jgi:hypothetical protein